MPKHDSDRVIEFLKNNAGEALRVVARYDGQTYEFSFVRDDIDQQYGRAELKEHVKAFRRDETVASTLERGLQAGDHHCSIRVFDDTIILNFTQGDGVGTIVSFDPTAGRDLLGFITESLRVLDAARDERIKSAPDWI